MSAAPGQIAAREVVIRVGSGDRAFDAVSRLNLQVEPRQFVCLLGPSGCGKSTLLGALAGHLDVASGTLLIDGQPISGASSSRGIVFQQHTLFPWKTVLDNVAFGPKMRGTSKRIRHDLARDYLARVDLATHADKYPSELSGGMQQRVEIARALVNKPSILLMDEPFGALDAQTRYMMQELLLHVWGLERTTVIFVTHDTDEALFLGDRVLVMSGHPGRIVEEIQPSFARPRDRSIVVSDAFVKLKRHCIDLLKDRDVVHPRPRLSPLGAA